MHGPSAWMGSSAPVKRWSGLGVRKLQQPNFGSTPIQSRRSAIPGRNPAWVQPRHSSECKVLRYPWSTSRSNDENQCSTDAGFLNVPVSVCVESTLQQACKLLKQDISSLQMCAQKLLWTAGDWRSPNNHDGMPSGVPLRHSSEEYEQSRIWAIKNVSIQEYKESRKIINWSYLIRDTGKQGLESILENDIRWCVFVTLLQQKPPFVLTLYKHLLLYNWKVYHQTKSFGV